MKDKRITTGYLDHRKVTFNPVNYGVIPIGGKLMTKAQKWAKRRNFAKFRIEGIKSSLIVLSEDSNLLATERSELRRVLVGLYETLNCWKARNVISRRKFMEGK